MEQLRRVLVGPEQARLEQIEARPAVEASAIAAALPEAVAESERPHDLAIALEPLVTETVANVAHRQPELYAEILAPAIGSAVRKAVSDAIAVILERFNEALQRSFSLESIRWRIEAQRTRRPYAEVVLARTTVYRAEQVLLIHTPTSLVLEHLMDPLLPTDPDQIAAMLSAIDSFAREAFRQLTLGAHIEKFEVGELTILVTRDPLVTLATVIRGMVTTDVYALARETHARISLSFKKELESFTGDVSPFAATHPVLEPLLRLEKRRPPPRRAHLLMVAGALLLASALATVFVREAERRRADARLRESYVSALDDEPGIVVTSSRVSRGRAVLSGFRDPLAQPPEVVLRRRGLPPARLDFVLFASLDPRIVERRAAHALGPPPAVALHVEDGTLRVAGVAPREWIAEAKLVSRAVAGVVRLDDRDLRSQESLDALRAAAAELGTLTITFEVGRAAMRPAQDAEVKRASDAMRRALEAAPEAHATPCLEVIGHTDPEGTTERNDALSLARARVVAGQLEAHGVALARLSPRGAGIWREGDGHARSVTFHLDTGGARCGAAP